MHLPPQKATQRVIYLDSAATSCPKPPQVVEAVRRSLEEVCANPGRGAYDTALEAGRTVLGARRAVAGLVGARDEARVVFTLNATHALNLALHGLIRPDSHVVTSSLEHNAVIRPLEALCRERNVRLTRLPASPERPVDPADLARTLEPDTCLVVMTHASNVFGTVMPIAEMGRVTRDRGIPFLVDAAQTAGVWDIDIVRDGIDLLAVPGHKGLLGPQGVGALVVGEGIEVAHFVRGGTGSSSDSLEHPAELPDRLEAGTPNTPGLAGLSAGIAYVNERGVDAIGAHERDLADRLKTRLGDLDGVTLYGPPPGEPAAPVVAVAVDGIPSAEVAFVLDRAYGIAVRAGLHCAPEAHRTAGTLDNGLVRISFGHASTAADADAVAEGLEAVVAKARARQHAR